MNYGNLPNLSDLERQRFIDERIYDDDIVKCKNAAKLKSNYKQVKWMLGAELCEYDAKIRTRELKAKRMLEERMQKLGVPFDKVRDADHTTYQILKENAGEDWDEIISDPKLFNAFKQVNDEATMRAMGEVPPNYKSIAHCHHCGWVYLPAWQGEKLLSCLWCLNRVKGLAIPVAVFDQSF